MLSLIDIHCGVSRDLRSQLRGGGSFDLATRTDAPGLHIIAMQSNHATSELPAIRVNDYAREEGIVPIIAARNAAGKTNVFGRERYSRRTKALIHVGQLIAANHAPATRPIGLNPEIAPDRNPHALGPKRMTSVHILYNGRRLHNATVQLTKLGADERPVAIAGTNRAGRAQSTVPATGVWLLKIIWSEPVRGDPKVDFDATF